MSSVGIMASSVNVGGGELLFNDPCDNFTLAPWTVAGTPTVIAGGKNGNGFNMPTGSTNTITYSVPSGKQTDSLTIGFWIKFANIASPHDFLLLMSDSAATTHLKLSVVSSSWAVSRGDGTGLISTGVPFAITNGVWYRVELAVKMHDTTGSASLHIDGVQAGSALTNVDTKNAGTKTVFDTIRIASRSIISAWQLDDIYLRNDITFMG